MKRPLAPRGGRGERDERARHRVLVGVGDGDGEADRERGFPRWWIVWSRRRGRSWRACRRGLTSEKLTGATLGSPALRALSLPPAPPPLETEAVAVNDPAAVFAVSAGELARPLASVVAVAWCHRRRSWRWRRCWRRTAGGAGAERERDGNPRDRVAAGVQDPDLQRLREAAVTLADLLFSGNRGDPRGYARGGVRQRERDRAVLASSRSRCSCPAVPLAVNVGAATLPEASAPTVAVLDSLVEKRPLAPPAGALNVTGTRGGAGDGAAVAVGERDLQSAGEGRVERGRLWRARDERQLVGRVGRGAVRRTRGRGLRSPVRRSVPAPFARGKRRATESAPPGTQAGDEDQSQRCEAASPPAGSSLDHPWSAPSVAASGASCASSARASGRAPCRRRSGRRAPGPGVAGGRRGRGRG